MGHSVDSDLPPTDRDGEKLVYGRLGLANCSDGADDDLVSFHHSVFGEFGGGSGTFDPDGPDTSDPSARSYRSPPDSDHIGPGARFFDKIITSSPPSIASAHASRTSCAGTGAVSTKLKTESIRRLQATILHRIIVVGFVTCQWIMALLITVKVSVQFSKRKEEDTVPK